MGIAHSSLECDINQLIHWTKQGDIEQLEKNLQEKRFKKALNEPDSDGWTALHWAASFKSSTIPILLKHGANLHLKDNDGCTPLHLTCRHSKTKGTKVLINAGANVNEEDKFKRTPLHRAARFGTNSCTKMLIIAGAEVDHLDKDNRTPLFFACQSRRSDNVSVLLYHDAFVNAFDIHGESPYTIIEKSKGKGGSTRILKLFDKANPDKSSVPSLKQLCRTFILKDKDTINNDSIQLPGDLYSYLGISQ